MCPICLNNGKEADVAGEEPMRGQVIGSRIRELRVGQGLCRFHRASWTKIRTWSFTLNKVRRGHRWLLSKGVA